MTQTNVRELFGLSEKEDIFCDFSCKEGSVRTGRLYLTTNYICYYSSVMGFSAKIIVAWLDVMQVVKDGSSGIMIRTAKKEPEGKEKKYVFSAFQQRDTSFKYIYRLWCNSSPYAEGAKDDPDAASEEEEVKERKMAVADESDLPRKEETRKPDTQPEFQGNTKSSDAQPKKDEDTSSVGSADTDIVGKTIGDESFTSNQHKHRLNEEEQTQE